MKRDKDYELEDWISHRICTTVLYEKQFITVE